MLKWMSENILSDRIRNERVHGKLKVASIDAKVREYWMRWFSDVQ